jgi:hypothetical protein
MNKHIASAKNAVARNKTKILTTALIVTTTAAVLSQIAVKQRDTFLKENGLFDAFWADTEE